MGLFSVVVLVGICQHAARPTATYRTLELGGDATVVGIIAGSYGLMALIFAIPLGKRLDSINVKFFLVAGIAAVAVGSLGSAFTSTLFGLALAQTLSGLGRMASQITAQVMVANRRHSNRDIGFARLSVATSISGVLGPLLAGSALSGFSIPRFELQGSTLSFSLGALFALAGLVVAIWNVPSEELGNSSSSTNPQMPAPIMEILRRKGVKQALFVGLTSTAILDLVTIYLPVLGESRGISPTTIGTLLALRAVAGFFSRLSLPRLLAFMSRETLLFISMLVGTMALLALSAFGTFSLLSVSIFVLGFVLGVSNPLTLSWLSIESPRRDRGASLSLRVAGNRAVVVVLPSLFGTVGAVLGAPAVFLAMAAMLLTNAITLKIVSGKSQPQ